MSKNPLAELLTRLLFERETDPASLAIVFRHRGAPDDVRRVVGEEIEKAGPHGVVLADGTTLPLHRVLEVQRGETIVWSRHPKAAPDDPG
jgi:uncharacterized protein (UPF0248 family)